MSSKGLSTLQDKRGAAGLLPIFSMEPKLNLLLVNAGYWWLLELPALSGRAFVPLNVVWQSEIQKMKVVFTPLQPWNLCLSCRRFATKVSNSGIIPTEGCTQGCHWKQYGNCVRWCRLWLIKPHGQAGIRMPEEVSLLCSCMRTTRIIWGRPSLGSISIRR